MEMSVEELDFQEIDQYSRLQSPFLLTFKTQ